MRLRALVVSSIAATRSAVAGGMLQAAWLQATPAIQTQIAGEPLPLSESSVVAVEFSTAALPQSTHHKHNTHTDCERAAAAE